MNSNQPQTDAQILKAQKQRLDLLRKELMQLHFLTLEEVEDILKKMQFMPQVAHNEALSVIKAAQSKQNDFLKKQMEKNPGFLDELENKVHQEYKKVIQKITLEENTNADKILDQLYENI